MSEHLEPCPFCGAGETRVDESTHWTGMRSQVISARVRHWCAREEGQPSSVLEIAGKTREDAVRKWNQRIAALEAERAAQQPQAAKLTNPYTGTPRDYRDVESDPAGVLIQEPGAPLRAAAPQPQASAEDARTVWEFLNSSKMKGREHDEVWSAFYRIRASLGVGK